MKAIGSVVVVHVVLNLLGCFVHDRAIRWHRWLRGGFQPDSLAIIAGCVAVSLASRWAVLGRKWLIARVFVVFATIATLTGTAMIAAQSHDALLVGLFLAIEAAWIVGSLVVVRLAGYRLTWQWRFGRGVDVSWPPATAAT